MALTRRVRFSQGSRTPWIWGGAALLLCAAGFFASLFVPAHSHVATPEWSPSSIDPGVCIDTSIVTPPQNWDVTLAGSLAYVARVLNGLSVYDVSNPSAPVFKDSYDTPGRTFDVEVRGNYAYVADEDYTTNSGVIVLNVTDPATVFLVGSNTQPIYPRDVEIRDSLLFVADASTPGTLWIMSIGPAGAPILPTVRGTYTSPHNVKAVKVRDTLAYLALAQDGMAIVNVAHPSTPVLVGSYAGLTSAYDIFIQDTIAYIANGSDGLALVDVSDPTAPVFLSACNTPGFANKVEVVNAYAHVADVDGDYQIIDVSDPSAPALFEAVDTRYRMLGLATDGVHTFGATDSALTVFVLQGQGLCGDGVVGPCEECDDQNLVRGDGCDECLIEPAVRPCALSLISTPDEPSYGLVSRDTLLFVAHGLGGLQIYTIAYPAAPVLLGGVNTPDKAIAVDVENDRVAVADGTGGLRLIDVSNPVHPIEQGPYVAFGAVADVDLVDTLAYIITPESLHVISAANPAAPLRVGAARVPGSGAAIRVLGNRAYVAAGNSGLQIVDISNPALPIWVGTYDSPGFAYDVDVQGDTAYLATGQRIMAVRVTNPASPIVLGIFPTADVRKVQRVGPLLYAVERDSGLLILDPEPPATMRVLATISSSSARRYLASWATDSYVFLAEYDGVRIQSISVLGSHWCGNGLVEPGELCDDGNNQYGDGCTPCCQEEPPPAVCGNGTVEYPEECDDGNLIAGDGCDPLCQREPAVCGNGILELGEECDDGNSNPNDECSNVCEAQSVCGNGVLEPGEQCDDGNADAFDGCNNACDFGPVCGDGVVLAPEECDDGGRVPGDGCDASCQYEHTCGDGNLELGEECDDGNLVALDGCSPECRIETCLIVLPGDVNVDGVVTSGDMIVLVNYVFKKGLPPLPCVANGDLNCSGSVTSADIIHYVNYCFKGGVAPCDICNLSPLAASCAP